MRSSALNTVEEWLGTDFSGCRSPSLRLEKFVHLGDNSKKDEIDSVVKCHGANAKPIPIFEPEGAVSFVAKLRSRLIVNQAGGILENAGLCLHPHFGAPYIPGSAVKGIARHAAWCEWNEKTDDTEKETIANRIAKTFGYPTGDKELDDFLAAHGWKDKHVSGSVAFLPAMSIPPVSRKGKSDMDLLVTDIVTPHGGNDWTDPHPNPFPAVKTGVAFKFSLAPVRNCNEDQLAIAQKWLKKGLSRHGIGAKTAAGYGAFKIDGGGTAETEKSYTLRLVSPAFLRGAEGDEGMLRESSLRGVLRYWWRIVFGSVLAEKDLKALETEIWGGSGKPPTASQIVVRLVPTKLFVAVPFNKESFARQLPTSFQSKRFDKHLNRDVITAPGLAYASYGMDDSERRRKVLEPGVEWNLEVSFRPRNGIESDILAVHMDLALKALCTYGGVGAKSRKGFGSLDCGEELDIEGEDFWTIVMNAVVPFGMEPTPDNAAVYNFLSDDMELTIPVDTGEAWKVVDRIGHAMKATASSLKHQDCKATAGLPGKIHGPLKDKLLRHQTRQTHKNPIELDSKGALKNIPRFASPLFVHVAPAENGMLKVNAIAFPSGLVRPENISRAVLESYLKDLQATLSETNWS